MSPVVEFPAKEGSMDHNTSEERVEEEVDGGVEDDE